MTRAEFLRDKNETDRVYNEFNHLFILKQKHIVAYGYYNDCPIYVIYDYIGSMLKRYDCELDVFSKDKPIKVKTNTKLTFSTAVLHGPGIGFVYYNRHYREFYIFVDKRFISCAGKYKQVVYDKILFHELGHIFNKDVGPVIRQYCCRRKYFLRNKERRADLTGKTLSIMFDNDMSCDTVYPYILKQTFKAYNKNMIKIRNGKELIYYLSNALNSYTVENLKLIKEKI